MTTPARARRRATSPAAARFAALAVAALVLAQIAATPFAGAGISRLPGVQGTYIPVGDLIVDGCIVAIALVVIWARPGNAIGWVMLTFALLGATQNFAEAYGVRAQAEPGSRLPLGPLALSLGASLWIPAAALPATLLLLSVGDDGIGLPGQTRPDGIGLTSIRQRAADLGGQCTVTARKPDGVMVWARLPLEVT